MKKIFKALAAPVVGALVGTAVALAPAAGATTLAPFAAFDSYGALVTQHPVFGGEHFTYKGREVTAVMVIQRSNGFGGYYWQFHTTPVNVLGGTVGIVTLVPVS